MCAYIQYILVLITTGIICSGPGSSTGGTRPLGCSLSNCKGGHQIIIWSYFDSVSFAFNSNVSKNAHEQESNILSEVAKVKPVFTSRSTETWIGRIESHVTLISLYRIKLQGRVCMSNYWHFWLVKCPEQCKEKEKIRKSRQWAAGSLKIQHTNTPSLPVSVCFCLVTSFSSFHLATSAMRDMHWWGEIRLVTLERKDAKKRQKNNWNWSIEPVLKMYR